MTSKYTVMIIEDDSRASYTLESTVNQHPDFTVVAISETCAEALLHVDLYKPMLIFVDITLPDGNGIDIIRLLREKSVQCDFVMTTAERETTTVEKAVQLGIIDYLVKPIRMSRVHQTLTDYKLYKQQLAKTATVDQREIDKILRKAPENKKRHTPKGIDATTLASLKSIILNENLHDFSANDIGERMKVSRITARRYLEFLESEGLIRLILNYNTGGRPRRLYQIITG